MRTRTATLVAVGLSALAGCSKQVSTIPAPNAPQILTFVAAPATLTRGQTAKLSFTTQGATEVSLVDQTGAEVPVSGTVEAGEVQVSPQQTTFYVLRATGPGGTDNAYVQVAVNAPLSSVFLVAIPQVVQAGESVSLVYSAEGGQQPALTDATGRKLALGGSSGVVVDVPARSTRYTFKATGPQGAVSATADVKVQPVVETFEAMPATAEPLSDGGRGLRLTWKTRGADALTLEERTFGTLLTTATPADVEAGQLDFGVPQAFGDGGTLPDGGLAGAVVPDRYPLHFTLTASTAEMPAQSAVKGLDSVVGAGPHIDAFDAPAAVSVGNPLAFSWSVRAARSELWLDGRLVFATAPGASASAAVSLPGPLAPATVSALLKAYDTNGFETHQARTLKAVKKPQVLTLTAPTTVATAASPATLKWTSSDASLVVVRVKGGPTLEAISTPAMVASGMTQVFPSRTTVVRLEAYNLAGDLDAKDVTIQVTTPANTSVSPDPSAPGATVQLGWNTNPLAPLDVIGLPVGTATSSNAPQAFVDHDLVPDATRLFFANADDGAATIRAPFGFAYPFAGVPVSVFTASVNGALVVGPSAPALTTNVDLTTPGSTPPLLAPFWDDLQLGDRGAVRWYLDASMSPRRLIVQWSQVLVGGNAASELTFQVQLLETGETRFVYRTLSDPNGNASGQTATVGIFAGVGIYGVNHGFNQPVLTQDQQLSWFTNGPAGGILSLKVAQSVSPGFFVKPAAGGLTWVFQPVRVFAPGAVVVNEAMPVPASGVAMGQFVELYNPSSDAVDLSGLLLLAESAPTVPFVIPSGISVPGRAHLVMGQTVDSSANDDAGVAFAWGLTEVPLSSTDKASLHLPSPDGGPVGALVSQLGWVDAGQGLSAQVDPFRGTVPGCVRSKAYGPAGSIGTPGAPNESCFPYALSSIPAALEVAGGAPLFDAGFDDTYAQVQLTTPFKIFQGTTSVLTVGSNGWLTFAPASPTSSESFSNRTTWPATTGLQGVLAAFWDDLKDNGNGAVTSRRVGDHQLVTWQHVTHLGAGDDLTFQVKLFDTGVIEVHHGELRSGSSSNYGNGNSATVGLELPTSSALLPVSVNQPLLVPNSAWRFTPVP